VRRPLFAHRYLADGSTEIICMNCLDVVCNVPFEKDAARFLDIHTCESAEPTYPRNTLMRDNAGTQPPASPASRLGRIFSRGHGSV